MLNHILLFILALSVIWILSGSIIRATDRVAKRYHKPGFAVAFFVLGFMTSIGEIAVAVNATIGNVPQVSAGNLVGASIVIFLLIVPLLAIFAKGVEMRDTMTWGNILLSLFIIAIPAVFAMDGIVMRQEGLLLILLYITLIYRLRKKHPFEETVEETVRDVEEELVQKRHATILDLLHITGGAILIFIAGHFLVEESIFFTDLLGVPASLAGLLVLSIGTNIPELTIAIRSVLTRHMDIAFGDYLGSAVTNSVIFAFLPLLNGPFTTTGSVFSISFAILSCGLVLFFFFCRSKDTLSRGEGVILFSIYGGFLLSQILTTLKAA